MTGKIRFIRVLRKFVVVVAMASVVLSVLACKQGPSASRNTADDLAANVVDIGVEALAKQDGSPQRQELDRRLERLFANSSKEADEAVVILVSFYLGEHNGEELEENLLSRGPRMIPILERYLHEEPTSLLEQYPKRVRAERTTAERLLKEDLEILRVQAGARRVSGASMETAPLGDQVGKCRLEVVERPEIRPGEDLVQPGESYHGAPVLRADIQEGGRITNVQLLKPSGIERLDARLLADVDQWKYAPRPHCGVVQANIVISVDWMLPK